MAGELTSSALLDQKVSIPSELRTAEWAITPQWVRERSFYMAGVHRAEILEEFRREAGKIVRGESSMAESERELREMLDRIGYKPQPGQEGTIKDLRTARRMQSALRTNVDLLKGWSRKERGLRAQIAVPAWELVRFVNSRVKRDWERRWQRAGGKFYEGRMIALKTDPIWLVLGTLFPDSLGVDYPPLAWGSGMGWQGVRRAEAVRLGVIPEDWRPEEVKPISSPNENLSVVPKVSEKEIRDELSEHLGGLAEWDGKRLVFTDPNGTRPYAPEKLAEVWKRPLPPVFNKLPGGGQMQREAFLDWVVDSGQYWNEGGVRKMGSRNVWDDFLRMLKRLQPNGRQNGELFRGLSWNTNVQFSKFLEKLRRNGYAARPEVPAESWAASLNAAQKYVAGQHYQVILRLPKGHQDGRDLAPLVRQFRDELLRREVPQGKLSITDDEIVLPSWAKMRVKKIGPVRETKSGKFIEIDLEEVK